MNIYQILETLRQVEEGSAQIGDRVKCPNNITGTIVADAGSSWIIVDDHAETEDDRLEFRKSDCTPITNVKENDDDDDWEDDEGDYIDDPRVHVKQSAVLPDHVQQQILRNPAMRADIIAAYKRQQGMAEESKFQFANPKQRPGDQVRGTEKATKKKSGAHPFAGRLVGAMEDAEIADEAKATKTRLDPKCWSGKKIGNPKTKVKGGVRVNNCVPVEEEWEDFVNEYGMTTGGTATGDAQKNPADQAKKTADTQADVQKLKAAGVPIPSGSQAVQSLMKEPGKDPASALDKQISAGLGQEIQDIVTKGDSSDVNQLAALIRKVNQRSGA